MRRSSNLFAMLVGFVWLWLVGRELDHATDLYRMGYGASSFLAAAIPLAVLASIVATVWVVNAKGRYFEMSGVVSAFAFFATMPFLFATFGGV